MSDQIDKENLVKKRQQLVEQVSLRPWLYNKNHQDYNNRSKAQQSWKEIAEIIGWNGIRFHIDNSIEYICSFISFI